MPANGPHQYESPRNQRPPQPQQPQQPPRRPQQPPVEDVFNVLASQMGAINNGVNMIRQMGSLLGLLR